MQDRWTDAFKYEAFMGRWSRDLARVFVLWLGIPDNRHWLEVGCGTGALTSRIYELCFPSSVVATDPAENYIAHARSRIPDRRVRFVVTGVENLPVRPDGYDSVVSLLALNFLPDPIAALGAMKKLTSRAGVVAACVWDYADGMQMLRLFWDAANELNTSAREFDEGKRFPICSAHELESAFRIAGFAHTEIKPVEIQMHFRDFEDYWRPFIGGPGPAPGYLASLPVDQQHELADLLQSRLPRQADGSIILNARAWAARGFEDRAT